MIDRLYNDLVPSENIYTHTCRDVTTGSERLQNLGPYARLLRQFSREGSLSCHTCCDTGPRFTRSHPKGRPSFASFDGPGALATYANPSVDSFHGLRALTTYAYPSVASFDGPGVLMTYANPSVASFDGPGALTTSRAPRNDCDGKEAN